MNSAWIVCLLSPASGCQLAKEPGLLGLARVLTNANRLTVAGARVKAYDPVSMSKTAAGCPAIRMAGNPDIVAQGCDTLVQSRPAYGPVGGLGWWLMATRDPAGTGQNDPFDPILFSDPQEKKEAAAEDKQDLEEARKAPEERTEQVPWWKRVGPGFVTGSADNDPVGVGAYSVAGAKNGYGLMWLAPVALPLMIAIQEMCGRVAAVTGRGLAGVMRRHYHPVILWGAVAMLLLANTISVWADLRLMAASTALLIPLPFPVLLTAVTAITVSLLLFIPYRDYVKYLKWLTLSVLAYIVTALMPSVHVDWGQVLRSFWPHWQHSPDFIRTIVGLQGTSISPYLFFWQSGETVEEEVAEGKADAPGQRVQKVSNSEIRSLRADTVTGMVASVLIAFAVMLCAAASLNQHGQTSIQTVDDVAKALRPLGAAAHLVFTLAIIAAGLLAIPTLAGSAAYAVAEAAGWRYGLYRRFKRAIAFYLTILAVVLVGYTMNFVGKVSPVQALVLAAVSNGVVAPPLIVMLLFICNDRKIMKKRFNRWASNAVGGIAAFLMAAGVVALLWTMAHGTLARTG